MSELNECLLDLFRAHGVEATLQGQELIFPGKLFKASLSIFSEQQSTNNIITVRLDMRLEFAPRQTIIESFAGFSETRDKAIADAIHNFTANSFHVLLAFFFQPNDQQVNQQDWVIGGRRSRVTVGNVGIRGKLRLQGEPMFAWFHLFQAIIEKQSLRPGVHWMRLYFAQANRKAIACEVLLDNLIWDNVAAQMAAFDWPSADEFYSVRVFLVADVAKGGTISPEDAVAWLADILYLWNDFTENDAYAAMADAGIPAALADRAYKFTQVAWSRELLAGLGIKFSPEYLCFDAAGAVTESGDLAKEACYTAAAALADRYKMSPGFKRLAMMSADFHAVNNALNGGSKTNDLVTGPPCLFLEPPTTAGMEAANRTLSQHMAAASALAKRQKDEPRKPWWQFWR